eukprot:12897780-Prorocentrum_lima.AAC.1
MAKKPQQNRPYKYCNKAKQHARAAHGRHNGAPLNKKCNKAKRKRAKEANPANCSKQSPSDT